MAPKSKKSQNFRANNQSDLLKAALTYAKSALEVGDLDEAKRALDKITSNCVGSNKPKPQRMQSGSPSKLRRSAQRK